MLEHQRSGRQASVEGASRLGRICEHIEERVFSGQDAGSSRQSRVRSAMHGVELGDQGAELTSLGTGVAGILGPPEVLCLGEGPQDGPWLIEQGATPDPVSRLHSPKACAAGTAQEVLEHGLGLVVLVVSRTDPIRPHREQGRPPSVSGT
jgi:hypothetical protein